MQNLQQILFIILFILFEAGFTQQWQYRTPMPTARKGMTSAVIDEKIWVIGGSQAGNNVLDVVEVYNPYTDSWDTGYSSIQHGREGATAQVFDGKIYLFGGSDQTELINQVEIFDPLVGNWEEISLLPTPRRGLTSIVVDSLIWLLGGTNMQGNYYQLVEIYNPTNNSWDTLAASLNYARSDAMATNTQWGIFIFGGNFFGPLSNVEQYNRGTQSWEIIGDMLYNCGSAGITCYQGQSWIIGGMGLSGAPLEQVQIFLHNGQQMTWQEGPPLNTPRRELVAATINNNLFAIGGRGTMGHNFYNIVEELNIIVPVSTSGDPVLYNSVMIDNYPNPFNYSTTLHITLPVNDEVKLELLNILGQNISTIFYGYLSHGVHNFHLSYANFTGIEKGSSVYFIRLNGKKYSKIHKILLLK